MELDFVISSGLQVVKQRMKSSALVNRMGSPTWERCARSVCRMVMFGLDLLI